MNAPLGSYTKQAIADGVSNHEPMDQLTLKNEKVLELGMEIQF